MNRGKRFETGIKAFLAGTGTIIILAVLTAFAQAQGVLREVVDSAGRQYEAGGNSFVNAVGQPVVGKSELCSDTLYSGFLWPTERRQFTNFTLQPTILLEGPYGAGAMATNLRDRGYLPNISPYGDGREVTSIPADAVDWVYIKLRETPEGRNVAWLSVFVRSDGVLIDADGSEEIEMCRVYSTAPTLFMVIEQRNHLDIMSRAPIVLHPDSPSHYDFTPEQIWAYRVDQDPMANLGGSLYGMIAGDVDGDGEITDLDRELAWNARNIAEYRGEDVNLDGVINARDRLITWNNRNKRTQVSRAR